MRYPHLSSTRRRRLLAASAALLIVVLVLGGSAHAAQKARPAWVIPESLNVRSGPRSESKVIAALTRGTKVYVTGFANKWCWCKLPSGRFGWVAEWLLQFSADKGRQIAVVSGARPATATRGRPPAWIGVSEANVRGGPGLGADSRGTLTQGTKVYILDRRGDWTKCKTPGGSGWVRGDLLVYDMSEGRKLAAAGGARAAAAPAPAPGKPGAVRKAYVLEEKVTLRSGPGSSRPRKAALVRGQTLYVYGRKGQWVKAAVHGGARGWVAEWLIKYDTSSGGGGGGAKPAGTGQVARMDRELAAWVTADSALVRRNPTTESEVKFRLGQGTKVKVAALSGHWCKVRVASGRWGWMAGQLVKFVPPGQHVTATEGGERVEVHVGWVARPVVNLRAAPDTDADQLTEAPLGTRLVIIGKKSDWYKVALEDGSVGWMSANYIDTREERLRRKQLAESGDGTSPPAHLASAHVATPTDFPSPTAPEGPSGSDSGSGLGSSLIATAMKYLGCSYVSGGSGPGGFDCSGFVSYVHRVQGIGVSRSSRSLFHEGTPISRDDLQPGDVLFFKNTYRSGISHVGLYMGGGKFIHAANHRGGVKITELDSDYYASKYVGARRMY
jgi:N-acetylmuramoyl-L-alanine amidase